MYCTYCGKEYPDGSRFCPMCGRTTATPPPVVEPPPRVIPVHESSSTTPAEVSPVRVKPTAPTSWHSPLFALFLSAILPGGGQAYNGQPIKGFFFFFFSILTIPYLFNLYDAYATAAALKRAGLSSGCSGFFWLFLQVWLAVNTAVLVIIVLTIAGVLT